MRVLVGILFLITIFFPKNISASDELILNKFINDNIIAENVNHFGLSSINDLKNVIFGDPLIMEQINSKTILEGDSNLFSIKTGEQYIPVLINGIAKFFIVVDKSGLPVSLGYKTLADELNSISEKFNVNIFNIKIYQNFSINSFLFSVPSYRFPNLTILEPGWDAKRASLASLGTTLEVLKNAEKGAR